MIEKAAEYIHANARVLEQRRFELLFEGGAKQPVIDAVKPYKTADGGYAYALEPDGRGPTSQPPHIWTALEALEDAGATDPEIPDHLETMTAPDGGVPVALPSLEPFPHAPWWRIGTEGSLLATSLIYAPLARHGVDHAWLTGAESFCWAAIDAIERTHPYEVEAAIAFLDAARDTDRAQQAAARLGSLVKQQNLVGTQPEGYSEGEIHHAYDFARRPDSLARPWFTDDEIEQGLDHLAARQHEDGGWRITWPVWLGPIQFEWSGIVTIAALKTLQAYGRT
jgi:hypothetical protein